MLLPSSLPAQAASAIGNSRIAARLADIPKVQPVFDRLPQRIADRASANPRLSASEMEFVSRLSSKRQAKQRRPAAIGEAMARAGLISTVAAGKVEKPRPRISVSRAWWRGQRA